MDPEIIEAARWWSWRRQRLDRTCRGVEDCLRSVVGVSSVNPHGALSLLARVPRLLKGGAVEGVIATKRAVRVPAMRRALYMVPVDTAHLAVSATRASADPRRALRRAGVDERTYERVRADVLTAAAAPVSGEVLAASIEVPPETVATVVRTMCDEGDLVRVRPSSLRANDFTLCATETWLGEPFRAVPPADALVWLAGDYLSAFGPATAEDFAWWSGAPATTAADALAGHDPAEVVPGVFIHARDLKPFWQTRPHLGRVNLLPKLDPYTMGYAPGGRARFAAPSVLPHIYDAGGRSLPVVLIEGEVGGTWGYRFTGDRLKIAIDLWDAPGPRLESALDAEAQLVGSFLEAERIAVERSLVRRPTTTRRTPARSTRRAPAKGGRAASPKRER